MPLHLYLFSMAVRLNRALRGENNGPLFQEEGEKKRKEQGLDQNLDYYYYYYCHALLVCVCPPSMPELILCTIGRRGRLLKECLK